MSRFHATRFNQALEEAKNLQSNYLEEYKEQLHFLEGIKRVHKKDGGDFQNLLKNFQLTNGGDILETEFDYKIGRWGNYSYIARYTNDKEEVEKMRETNPERIISEGLYIKDKYFYNVEELEQKIKDKIEWTKKHIEELEEDLKNFDNNGKELQKILEKLGATLDSFGRMDYTFAEITKKAI